MADGVILRLALRDGGFGEVLRERTAHSWIRSLGAVPGGPLRLQVAGPAALPAESTQYLEQLCAEAGVELVDAPDDEGVIVLADAADLPGPHLLAELVDIARAGAIADARTVPVGIPAPSGPAGAGIALPAPTWAELGRATGDALTDRVRASHLPVRTTTDTALFHDVRLDAAGAVVEPSAPHLVADGDAGDPEAPFLSIVTRTQGTRLSPLSETLTCLAAQTVRDFEVVLVCHRTSAAAHQQVVGLVASFPDWFRERVRIVDADRPGRAAPLNVGFEAARGRFVAALDDDDTVLAHWVETFRALATSTPGRVLRTGAVRQDVLPVTEGDDEDAPIHLVAKRIPVAEWPGDFSLIDHLHGNFSPFMSVAFPREVVRDHGLRFDETLPTTEDWEFLMRAIATVGIVNDPDRTSVYRWWSVGASRSQHHEQEWVRTREAVLQSFDELAFGLPPGSAHRVAEMQAEIAWLSAEVDRLQRDRLAEQLTRLQAAHDQAIAERDAYLQEIGALRIRVRELTDALDAGRSRRTPAPKSGKG